MILSKKLLEIYGEDFQLDKLIEECAELINAISKHKQSRIPADSVLSEVADVQLCLRTAILVLNKNGNYNRILNDKIVRIKQREGLL